MTNLEAQIIWPHCITNILYVKSSYFCISKQPTPSQLYPTWQNKECFVIQLVETQRRNYCSLIGPPMITVLKKKISFDRIIGPSVFKLLSVPVSVCVSVCLSVCVCSVGHSFDHTCRSTFRYIISTAWCHKKNFLKFFYRKCPDFCTPVFLSDCLPG